MNEKEYRPTGHKGYRPCNDWGGNAHKVNKEDMIKHKDDFPCRDYQTEIDRLTACNAELKRFNEKLQGENEVLKLEAENEINNAEYYQRIYNDCKDGFNCQFHKIKELRAEIDKLNSTLTFQAGQILAYETVFRK